MEQNETKALTTFEASKQKFEMACERAQKLELANNVSAAFTAVDIVSTLREALTPEIMQKVFMPLMNTKIGFLTDRNGKARSGGRPALPLYSVDVVRDCLIDAVSNGLLATGNQFNIIAERMYPTKEGYTALLKKIGAKYLLNFGNDQSQTPGLAEIPVTINFEYRGEKKSFKIIASLKKDEYSSMDQLKGKAERRAKKVLYEYLTGCDLGEADETSSEPIDVEYEEQPAQPTNINATIAKMQTKQAQPTDVQMDI